MSSPESYHVPILPPFSSDSNDNTEHDHHHRSKYDHSLDKVSKELGKVMRVRDSYGFIYSYTREEDVFFHFSEIVDTASGNGTVTVGDDVEYEYGYSNNNKGAAFRVKVVNVDGNTMRKTGIVDKVAKGNAPGIIRLLNEGGLTVKYTLDYCRDKNNYVLGKGDIVQVTLGTANGGRKLLGKDIVVIESKEEKMLQTIPLEQGVIISLKEDCYGFIQSIKRKEHVYFHYSHLLPSCDRKDVKIGKCVEFKAINETLDNSAQGSPAARQLHFLPDDSVQFRTVVHKAVKGVIVTLPYAETPPRGKKKKSALAQFHHPGTIRISPITIQKDQTQVTSALFHIQDVPTNILSWMKEGDELLFDLAIEHLDNTYCIQSPTLTNLALPGRAEGTITVLKEGFGFISLAERQADVYFRLSDNVLPSYIQTSLLKDNNDSNNTVEPIVVGTEVSFDLSIASSKSSNHNHHKNDNKENLKADRILPLPIGSIVTQKVLATKVRAVITQIHQDGKSGYLELEEPVQGMTFEEHHPLIASMIDSFLSSNNDDHITYADVQSPHESRFIIALAESKGLNVSFVSDTTTDSATTCLRIKISKDNSEQSPTSSSSSNDQNAPLSPTETNNKKKKKLKVPKPVKLVRFDKKHAIYSNNDTPMLGDIVTCDVIHFRRTQTYSAINILLVERVRPTIHLESGKVTSKSKQKSSLQHNCIGLILMEPSHSNISINHYSSSALSSSGPKSATSTGRWDNVTTENHQSPSSSSSATANMSDGFILLLESKEEEKQEQQDATNDQKSTTLQHLVYHNEHNHHDYRHISRSNSNHENNPKRGEFVSFHYIKGGKVKDVKLLKNYPKGLKSSSAKKLIGTLTNIDKDHKMATFQTQADDSNTVGSSYTISTNEILGCDLSSLKSTTQVEAMYYQNNVYGVCRLSDLYLASSSSKTSSITTPNSKARPRLNLTVRKELGGKVVAQSSMAKGPSHGGGNYGFLKGWTNRCSRFEVVYDDINATTVTTADDNGGSVE